MSSTLTGFKYTDANGLQAKLKEELKNLREKEYKSYWPRFLIRRISLYAIPFLMFFTFFFCLSLTKKVGVEKANAMIDVLSLPAWNSLFWGVAIIILVLLGQWLMFNRKFFLQTTNDTIKTSRAGYKNCAHGILFIGFILLFLSIYGIDHKLYYGFLTFLVLTLCPLLIDRTLGLTRQNERFKLYIRRLERLNELNVFREKINIKFEEPHFIEYMKLVDEADHSKNQDTVSDTSYFMTLIENKLKA
ncbi:TPA: MFS transporter [Escherichia coli]|uniref:antiviral RADAR system accessory protein RdrD n=1 Tax=Escherichia coli TaxID=562 RepID=UPI0017727D66|nr:antiviral RADAR system accessory protein RdrD [Escherichia coli]EII3508330.1 hypothetical protein [Escherichia coli]EKS5498077.1 hypothetical protein [Escherichia coli]EKU0877198.1 hypothetical protein [Escherichia coli]EKU2359867.1 hypothetical protein [Escherichia coli]MCQ4703301.1 hypothetical protein [Escherichia coli]